MQKKILLTGCAGFIGAATTKKLLERGDIVIGIDNLNDYYDVSLKEARLSDIKADIKSDINSLSPFTFYHADIKDRDSLFSIIEKDRPDYIINLAAQAGVRYSLENPNAYIESNLIGFANILEAARKLNVKHLLYASSSSVYGGNEKLPYSVTDRVDHPLSLYAATKKSNELMAHSYSHLYDIPATGLRFFTVYGPWGRPDMAPIKFAKKIMDGEPIQIYNHGNHSRDFTYIDDIVEGIIRTLDKPPEAKLKSNQKLDQSTDQQPSTTSPYKIYNIGCGNPTQLLHFIEILENQLGKKAIKEMYPKQPGDVDNTWADTKSLEDEIGYRPTTSIEEGVTRFSKWFKEYYV